MQRDYDLNGAGRRGRQADRGHARLVGADLGGVHRAAWSITVDPASGRTRGTDLRSPISNSFAVDETGGVYIAADDGLHRLDAAADGTPRKTWSQTYRNSGIKKPGQTQAGIGHHADASWAATTWPSPTTPTP